MKRNQLFLNIFLISLLMLPIGTAVAQTAYPTKAVRWIVPYAPGGGTDILVRAVGQKFADGMNVPVVVDNRPGGGTNIGAEAAARSAPDGYTLFAPGVANAINVALFAKLNYDIVRDFVHVSNLCKIPGILVSHPSLPAKNAQELIALARARPGELRHGSPGIGSPQHLGAELFKSITGIRMIHVPYRGAAPAITDVVGGHTEVYFGAILSTLPQVKNGRLRALAVTSLKRVAVVPEIATLNEQGLKGFESASWIFVSVPASTPRDIVNRLHREAVRATGMQDVRERMAGEEIGRAHV